MSQDAWNEKSTEPEIVKSVIRMLGTGAAVPTKVFGRGLTLTRTSAGIINLIWIEYPGNYVGITGDCFEATVQNGLKGYTVVAGDWNAATRTITINITNAADTLTDLAAAQSLTLEVAFKRVAASV